MQPSDLFPDPRAVALVEASMSGDEETARRLVASGVPVDVRGRQGVTPLLWAVAHGDLRAMDILLRLGADLRAIDERGRSGLVLAAAHERVEVLKKALAAGGNPDERTPLGEPLLFVAVDQLSWDHIEAILDAGADINATDREGQTAILRLAILNQYEHVAKLIDRGAKVNLADLSGWTLAKQVERSIIDPESPLASWREQVKKMLRDRGIDVGDGR